MAIRPEEITSVIERELEQYEKSLEQVGVGSVLQVGDGIARLYGLEDVMAGEMVEFSNGVKGLVLNLEEDNVGVVVMGVDTGIREGDSCKRTGTILDVPVGDALVGRVVNAIGEPIDGKGPIVSDKRRRVDVRAPGVIARKSVHEPLQTGIKAID